jgi:hypothetical protein
MPLSPLFVEKRASYGFYAYVILKIFFRLLLVCLPSMCGFDKPVTVWHFICPFRLPPTTNPFSEVALSELYSLQSPYKRWRHVNHFLSCTGGEKPLHSCIFANHFLLLFTRRGFLRMVPGPLFEWHILTKCKPTHPSTFVSIRGL